MTDCVECFYELEPGAETCPACGSPVHEEPPVDMNEFEWQPFDG